MNDPTLGAGVDGEARVPLCLYVRPPVAGATKSRLARGIGATAAAQLYRGFIIDTLAHLAAAPGVSTRVSVAGDPEAPSLRDLVHDYACASQCDGGLGERMQRSLRNLVEEAGAGIILGSDAPTLPSSYPQRAAELLASHDVVLGPACDGGFYLIGVRHRVPDLFTGVRYSTNHALSDTRERALAVGLRIGMLAPWYDVDTAADLRLLRTHLALDPAAAPATAAALATGGVWPGALGMP